ncbi:MAG TPA: hypothetical protein PKH39_07815 [Woeseiaceae bacterium]|nr:hypothetical protein [Woeseiaceae bacterium]
MIARVFLENTPHNRCLILVDGAVAAQGISFLIEAFDDVVAIGNSAARFPAFYTAAQAPACLVSEILQEQRIHRAFQTDVQGGNRAL